MRGAWGPARQRLLVLALVTATAVFLATVPLHRDWFDVGVYYGTVNYWVHQGGDLYDYVRPGTRFGFTYPPFAALCMLPMALVSWPTAVTINLVLGIGAAAALLYWLVGPVIRRQGWTPWFAYAVAGCLFALLEPVRDTFSFGQINLLLMALVFADARLLAADRTSGWAAGAGRMEHGGMDRTSQRGGAGGTSRRGGVDRFARAASRCAGAGIGLATAIKLTPAAFICYLLLTRRWRPAGVAVGTAAAATLLGARVAPEASRTYWSEALWNTGRVGSLDYVSNQSLEGVLARLQPADPSRTVWVLAVLAVLGVWAYRGRRAAAAGDELSGFALTGLAACLISPVTWVHHLVWVIPSIVVLADTGLRSAHGSARRRRLLGASAAVYVLLCSSVVWLWRFDASGVGGFLGSNAYVWTCLLLLTALPTAAVSGSAGPRPHHPRDRDLVLEP